MITDQLARGLIDAAITEGDSTIVIEGLLVGNADIEQSQWAYACPEGAA